MRLSEIRKIVAENKAFLSVEAERYPRDTSFTFVSNIPELLGHLDKLSKVPNLTGYIDAALSSAPTISSIGTPTSVIVSTDEFTQFHSHIINLSRKCDTIIELANAVLPPTEKICCA
jgi:hypothetical protein